MQLTAIQLNTRHGKHYDAISDYLQSTQADIIGLQEVASGILSSAPNQIDFGCELANTLGYHYQFGARYGTHEGSQMGYAILSKYPIIDSQMHYLDEGYKIITDSDALIATGMTTDVGLKSMSYELDQTLPSGVLECVIDIAGEPIRVMTSKFPASPDHQESELMHEHVRLIHSIVAINQSPVIVMVDANITPTSKVIKELWTSLDPTLTTKNTLNSSLHPGFAHGIPPQGLQVDYIITQYAKCMEAQVDHVNISDHYPVRAKIDINQLKQCGKII